MSRNERKYTYEHVRLAKTFIRIRAVWSESSQNVFRIVKDATFLYILSSSRKHSYITSTPLNPTFI